MALSPYTMGSSTTSSANATTITSSHAAATGDKIIVCTTVAVLATTVSSVTDSGSNTYSLVKRYNAAGSYDVEIWEAPCTTALTTSSTVTVNWSGTQTAPRVAILGCAGLAASGEVDSGGQAATNSTSASPSSGNTGTLAQADELAVGIISNGNAGGAVSWTSPWASLFSVQAGATEFMGVGWQETPSTAAIAAQGTITSTNWTAMAVTFKAAAIAVMPLQASRRAARAAPPPSRRFRQMLPVPPQLNPPYPWAEIAQRRQAWPRGLPRRGHATFAVPPQLNPPYPFAEIRQQRQLRGLLARRGRAAAPVPGQHEPPRQRARARPRAMLPRRGRATVPLPQAQAAAPPAWVAPHRVPLRALALIRRRFAQLLPWPRATAPVVRNATSAPVVTVQDISAAIVAAQASSATVTAAGGSAAAVATQAAGSAVTQQASSSPGVSDG